MELLEQLTLVVLPFKQVVTLLVTEPVEVVLLVEIDQERITGLVVLVQMVM